jgi:sugar (pentulose or hexulose) kinase
MAVERIVAGFDFSTGSVKGLAWTEGGDVVAEVRLPTDLWTAGGVSELNLMQLEGQARAAVRGLAGRLRSAGLLERWAAIGISATHHTAGRIDSDGVQVRRAICWNDQTLAAFHEQGLARLGGQEAVRERIGGPWAVRYSLTHLLKDEATLPAADWQRTRWILPHGPLVAGYLTGRFNVCSVSSAASTGIMDLRTNRWHAGMLDALAEPVYRQLAAHQLPAIIAANQPIGPLSESVALDAGLPAGCRPVVFPTSDDQQAGLIGGGAVEAGDVAVILGNSAVVNSSAGLLPRSGTLDAMRLNWGPYLWMRCYTNGAQFLDHVVGANPDWAGLEAAAREVRPGCDGVGVLPFVYSEPSLGIAGPRFEWSPDEPRESGVRFRAALEALAYLAALGVREHEAAGQPVRRVIVSGGIARSDLMGEILASVLGRPVERLVSSEGPALGAAVTALWGLHAAERPDADIRDAVRALVRYRTPVEPIGGWAPAYQAGLAGFAARLGRTL